ncbi:MAG: sigma-54 dependent transcriptional regulator [Ignavibacteriota bacterium]|nr:sigma-54 dependent transcriptional regulator [Ignavibacteriota bacterium]
MSKSFTLIARNAKVRELISNIDRIVDSNGSVLLTGETGVGKEIFAEYIHRTSNRANKPFVKLSLSAMPAELLESELFGHDKGAYTSAVGEKKGLFEIADTGSIFLDDIDDVPLKIQTKLLRVLESREIQRVGGTKTINIDVRLITASKINLKELVEKGIFRSDLFYRINVVPFDIPPLRERRDDIEPLIEYFIKHFDSQREISISGEALKAFINYSWPGNVRELKNHIQRILLFINEEIKLSDLPAEIRSENPIDYIMKACNNCYLDGEMNFDQIIKCLEHNLVEQALAKEEGNQSRAAKKLGLSLSTFRDKLKKYNINTHK